MSFYMLYGGTNWGYVFVLSFNLIRWLTGWVYIVILLDLACIHHTIMALCVSNLNIINWVTTDYFFPQRPYKRAVH